MSERLPRTVAPETFAIHGAYEPSRSEGSVKPPRFTSSTYSAKSAGELAHRFRQAYGLDDGHPSQPDGLIYARLVSPNLQIFEERWVRFEGAEQAALFRSGMAAISTTMLTLCRPGDQVLYSGPVYGGTDYLMTHVLPEFGVESHAFLATDRKDKIRDAVRTASAAGPLRVVFIETPANPTLALADIRMIVAACDGLSPRPIVVVDATVLGPIFQRPLEQGADLVIHSATKSIGGHSDLLAGVVAGYSDLVSPIKAQRTISGDCADPDTAWMLLRSLETYKVRVEAAEQKALKVVRFLRKHPAVEQLFFPGMTRNREQMRRFREQCSGHGSLMSFAVRGGREAAYSVLDAMRVADLAVSLGGTETLVEHPRTHTHSDVSDADLDRFGIGEGMIRLSVGLEDADDVIADLDQALAKTR